MNLFSKKEKLVENIALFGLVVAINVIFVVLSTFVPFFLFILVFLLSFSSAIVTLLCKKRYFILYAIATLAICMVINISDALFFVLPAIITGFIFSLFTEKKIPTTITLFASTLVHIVFTYISYFLINFIFKVSVIDTFFIIFKLTDFEYKNYLIAPFIFLIALGQTIFSYLIIETQLPKLGYEQTDIPDKYYFNVIGILISCLFTALSVLLYSDFSLLFLCFTLWFSISEIIRLILKKQLVIYIVLGIDVMFMIVFYAIFVRYIPSPNQLLLLEFFALEIVITSLVFEKLILSKRI